MRELKPEELFTMLQDLKHIIIIDTREQFSSFIRGSFFPCSELENQIQQHFNKYQPEDRKFQRVVFVDQPIDLSFDKKFVLKNFESFQSKYPFLCVNDFSQQIDILYANSQFPSIILDNELYIGNTHHANCARQLKDLGICSLINFSHKNQKEGALACPIDPNIPIELDFDLILMQINELKKPYLFFCQDADSISTGFAIAYLMSKYKKNIQTASLIVFSKRNNNAKICKWLYTQLMIYQPDKTTIIN